MVNVFDPYFDPADDNEQSGFVNRRARVGRQAGSRRIGASVYELPPGQALCPYHWQAGNEEMIIVLSGRPSIRTPEGWRRLDPGELVPFPRGPEGAHQVANRGDEEARVLMLSELNGPEVVVYPDSDKAGVLSRPPGSPPEEGGVDAVFKLGDDVDYWLDEQPPADE
ncbi:MAG TPA: cupin domain-containing protein [Solirubrobacterales bacterium]|jgi:uncharacterized cupin superfamily protein